MNRHHSQCGQLSVPDIYIDCRNHTPPEPTFWCGCKWRCPKCDPEPSVDLANQEAPA